MEIKKSNKLLKALIATSFVGVVVTPIVLTSCSKKKEATYEDQLLKEINFKEEVKNVKDKDGKFSDFDESHTKTLTCVVGDDQKDDAKNQEYKSFVIVLTLPFDDKTKDEEKKFSFNDDVKPIDVGCKNNEHFVTVGKGEKTKDENGKIQYKFKVTINDNIKSLVEPYGDEKVTDLSPDKTYSKIEFVFTDKNNKEKTATFTYKVAFDQPKTETKETGDQPKTETKETGVGTGTVNQ